MIGKTTVNKSTVVKNWKNKDKSLWSLVLSALVLAIAFHSPKSFPQSTPSPKAKPAANSASATEDIDDNNAESADSDNETLTETAEAIEADDNVESTDENAVELSTELPPQAPVAEETEPPVAESMPEAPPAEAMQTEIPVETVPVEPPSKATNQEPEFVFEPANTESAPNTKVTEADMVEVIPREKNVEIEPRKRYTHYRDRRTTHGFLFSFNAENLYFQDYASLVDQKLYEELFGQEDLTLLQVQVDYKLNFMLGSLIAGAGFGHGTLIDDRVGEERGLTISKKSLRAQWLLDSITKEPYFVPYVGASLWQFGISEENKTLNTTNRYDTGNGTALTVGFLIQLNWLEPDVAKGAYLAQGLENTYLDVFWTQYQNTDDELDPIFENDFNFGVGLRMEF